MKNNDNITTYSLGLSNTYKAKVAMAIFMISTGMLFSSLLVLSAATYCEAEHSLSSGERCRANMLLSSIIALPIMAASGYILASCIDRRFGISYGTHSSIANSPNIVVMPASLYNSSSSILSQCSSANHGSSSAYYADSSSSLTRNSPDSIRSTFI